MRDLNLRIMPKFKLLMTAELVPALSWPPACPLFGGQVQSLGHRCSGMVVKALKSTVQP